MKTVWEGTLECVVCGQTKKFELRMEGTILGREAFERKLAQRTDALVKDARAWEKVHQHGATARGHGKA